MSNKSKKKAGLLLLGLVMLILGAAYIYPVFLMFINSFKPFGEVVSDVLSLPSRLELQNYIDVMGKMNYWQLFRNNIVITVIGVAGIVFFSALAAYVIDRMDSRFTRLAHLLIITPMLIPFQTIMITLLKVMNVVKLSGSTWGLGVQYWGCGIPMATFIYCNFIKTIPKEIDESATIDGASTFRTFRSIIFPLMRSVSVTVAVLDIMWIWNDFLLPLLMVNSRPATKTLVLAAYTFVGQFNTQWHYAMTAMVLAVLPSIIVFIFLQRYIVEGVVSGAVKG